MLPAVMGGGMHPAVKGKRKHDTRGTRTPRAPFEEWPMRSMELAVIVLPT